MAKTHELPDDGSADILDFARRWYPYGGGTAEDILLEFGITEHEYFRRLAAVLDSASLDDTDPVIEAIRGIASTRQIPDAS